jgi:hypothetical protein
MPRDAAFAELDDAGDASRTRALSVFQKDMGLPVTGEADAATLAMLRREYGC